jgi:hypothetical protein
MHLANVFGVLAFSIQPRSHKEKDEDQPCDIHYLAPLNFFLAFLYLRRRLMTHPIRGR